MAPVRLVPLGRFVLQIEELAAAAAVAVAAVTHTQMAIFGTLHTKSALLSLHVLDLIMPSSSSTYL